MSMYPTQGYALNSPLVHPGHYVNDDYHMDSYARSSYSNRLDRKEEKNRLRAQKKEEKRRIKAQREEEKRRISGPANRNSSVSSSRSHSSRNGAMIGSGALGAGALATGIASPHHSAYGSPYHGAGFASPIHAGVSSPYNGGFAGGVGSPQQIGYGSGLGTAGLVGAGLESHHYDGHSSPHHIGYGTGLGDSGLGLGLHHGRTSYQPAINRDNYYAGDHARTSYQSGNYASPLAGSGFGGGLLSHNHYNQPYLQPTIRTSYLPSTEYCSGVPTAIRTSVHAPVTTGIRTSFGGRHNTAIRTSYHAPVDADVRTYRTSYCTPACTTGDIRSQRSSFIAPDYVTSPILGGHSQYNDFARQSSFGGYPTQGMYNSGIYGHEFLRDSGIFRRSGIAGQSAMYGQPLMSPGSFAPGMTSMNGQLGSSQLINLKKIFSIYDRDASGRISARELFEALRATDPMANEQQIYAILARFDRNGDSMVDFPEFINLYSQMMRGY